MRRPLLRLGLALATILVSLELLLQILAFGAAWLRSDEGIDDGRPAVLCVGDSLTWGLGAERDESWPARLAEALGADFPALRVVNDARPGQTSRDVLERLGPRLESMRPDLVCILCGWNDTWSRPPPLEVLPREASSFRWRWRTLRLLRLAFADGPETQDGGDVDAGGIGERAFVGTWHVLGREFSFRDDGTAHFEGLAATWTPTSGGVRLRYEGAADGGFRIALRTRHDGRLEILADGWHQHLLAHPGPARDATPSELAGDLVEMDLEEPARAVLEEALEGAPDRLEPVASLVRLGLCESDEELRVRTAALRQAWDTGGRSDDGVGLALATGLHGLEDDDGARIVLREVCAAHPLSTEAWELRIDLAGADPERRAALRHALREALEGSPPDTPARGAVALLLAATAADADDATSDLLTAAGAGVQVPELTEPVAALVAGGLPATELQDSAGRLAGADQDASRRVRTAIHRGTADDDEVYEVLEKHLEMAVEASRSAGADVVLLGYPFAMERHQALVEALAERHALPVVENRSRFDALLADAPREDWFVDPIHCTARGYAEMAARAEPRVRAALDGRRDR